MCAKRYYHRRPSSTWNLMIQCCQIMLHGTYGCGIQIYLTLSEYPKEFANWSAARESTAGVQRVCKC